MGLMTCEEVRLTRNQGVGKVPPSRGGLFSACPPCPGGGIGRRAGFRYQWVTPWRFESSPGHHQNLSIKFSIRLMICRDFVLVKTHSYVYLGRSFGQVPFPFPTPCATQPNTHFVSCIAHPR